MELQLQLHNIELAHSNAMHAAQTAAQAFADTHFGGGDGGACGFAWIEAYGVRSNSKLGKALQAIGFSKSHTGGLRLHNTWYRGQSVDAADAGAQAYKSVFRQLTGLEKVYAVSRLD